MKARAPVYQFGPFEFEPSQYELRRGDDRNALPASLNKLLLLFVAKPGELVTREEIADTLWESHGTVDVAAGINTAVRRLRSQLGEGNGNGIFIETVVGVGYRFAKPVSVAVDEEPGGLTAALPSVTPEPEPIPLVPATAPVRTRLWAAVAVVLLVAAGGGWTLFSHRFVRQPAAASLWSPLHTRRITFDEPGDRLTAQAISPSGAYLAFLDRAGLTVRSLSSGPDRVLPLPKAFRAVQIAWPPDESYLLVGGNPGPVPAQPSSADTSGARAQSQIWRVPLRGEPARKLLDDAVSAAVSPDGHAIAFLRAGRSEIWVAGADGGSPRKLASAPSGDLFTCLLWSPNGNRIVADRSDHGLPPLTGAGTEAGSTKTEASEPQPSRNTSVYESFDTKTGALLGRREDLRFDSAALLKDGTLLYPVDAPQSDSKMAIVQTDPATGAVLAAPRIVSTRQFWSLTSFSTTQLTPAASGDALSAILERPVIDVYTADLIAGDSSPKLVGITRLTHHNGSDYPTAWTPDGKEVLLDSGTGGPISVLSQPLDGTGPKALAEPDPKQAKFAQGQISPDGRWLLFLHLPLDSDQVAAIDRIPAQGGKRETLRTVGQVEEFHCSAPSGGPSGGPTSGRCVLREAEGKSALVYYALDPVTGMGAELARTPWQPNILGDWSISPDGNTVAVASHDPRSPGIQLVPLAAGASGKRRDAAVKFLPVSGFGATLDAVWYVDGKAFFVESYTATGYNLIWLTLDGRTALLRQSPDLIYAVPSPDGKKIAFPARTELNRNVWVGTRGI